MSSTRLSVVLATCGLLVAAGLAIRPGLPTGLSVGRAPAAADAGEAGEWGDGGYGELPVWFEANRGQVDPQADFVARAGGEQVLLTGDGPVFPVAGGATESSGRAVLGLDLVGAAQSRPEALGRLPGRSNYLIGSDPAGWRTGVPHFGQVAYRGVWPGVDLVYRGQDRQLVYDFVVAPGTNPSTITVAVEGADDVEIDGKGALVARAGGAELRQSKPVLYQEVGGRRHAVQGSFRLLGGSRFGFHVGDYDRTLPLVIDPILTWSTLLGGTFGDSVTAVAVDASGNAYAAGSTASSDFPRANAVQGTKGAGTTNDAFVTKMNPAGTGLLWSTFLGGSLADDATGIAVDGSGNVTVAGSTASTNFPTANAFQSTKGAGTDAFVARINAAGSAITYSTYLGGGGADAARGVDVDPAGTAYVVGTTASLAAAPFPTVNPVQAVPGGANDVFVAHLDPTQTGAASLVWSTHLGGAADDEGAAIAVDAAGSAYVTGSTRSADFDTASPLKGSISGACPTADAPGRLCREAFVTKLAPAGNALVYSTYLGGTTSTHHLEIGEAGAGIDVDGAGNAYVVGQTSSDDFPAVNAPQGTRAGDVDAFATKLNAAGSAIVYSTYLGGFGTDLAADVAVDPAGSAHLVGNASATYPRVHPIAHANGNTDAFVTQLSPAGSAILHSSHLGGSASEAGRSVAVDGAGAAYVGGNSFSSDFPTISAFQASPAGDNEGFVARVSPGPASGPLVTGVSPRSGPVAGGTPIVLSGTGFTGVTGIDFGGIPAPSFDIQSPTRIVVVAPEGTGERTITVRTSAGTSPANPVARYVYAEGLWSPTGPQTRVRLHPTITLLADGKVLMAGGRAQANGPALASAELYDPRTNSWTATGSMATPRFSHSATALANGRLLVAGGFNLSAPVFNASGGITNAGPVTDTAEVFDPVTGSWSQVGSLITRRAIHEATRLPDGRVLVAGGRSCELAPPNPCDATRFTNTAEVFNPAAGTWSATASMAYGRHTADMVNLADGRVLIAGGFGELGDHIASAVPSGSQKNLDTAELYNPATGTWSETGRLNIGRARHNLVRLLDGRVLAVAGFNATTATEVFDPATGQWRVSAPLPTERSGQCSVTLPTGDVLTHQAGSYPTDLYDSESPGWRSAGLTTAAHSCGSGVTQADTVVLSSSIDRFEANPAVCGRNCGKAMIAGDSDHPVSDLYTHAPVITGIQPVDSPAGTIAVTITGLGFSDASAVTIGGQRVLEFKVESYDRITAVLPQGVLGSAAVTITTPGGRSAPLSVQVTQVKGSGYWLVASDGGVFAFGDAPFHGSTGAIRLNRPVVGMAATPSGRGYWLVASDGGVFAFGDAQFHGSTGNIVLNRPIVGMSATPSGKGYRLVASDGGVFAFGDAQFHGSTGGTRLNQPVVGMAATPSGNGYWLTASDGGVFAFGDASFHGSTGAIRLNQPMVAMAASPSGRGYRLVASDGGVFAFGDAQFHGSTGAIRLNRPVVGTAATPTGGGYWLIAADGGVFAFGDAVYLGSTGNLRLNQPVVGGAVRLARIPA